MFHDVFCHVLCMLHNALQFMCASAVWVVWETWMRMKPDLVDTIRNSNGNFPNCQTLNTIKIAPEAQ
jgi:hypothetical protein